MYAIVGATGQVGSATARSLMESGYPVRLIARDPAKLDAWRARGATVATANLHDAEALRTALSGVQGAFVMIPPNFAPLESFPEARTIIEALRRALEAARPLKIVCLSSVGAQQTGRLGLITQLHMLEQGLASLGLPIAFLRAAWFMENAAGDIADAQARGEIDTFLDPPDRPIPMVATAEIGAVAAGLLLQNWTGTRIVELEGPRRYSPNDVAATLGHLLGRPVHAVPVPRDRWAAAFEQQGAVSTLPRIEMLDGFNAGWIDFQRAGTEHVAGQMTLEEALRALVAQATGYAPPATIPPSSFATGPVATAVTSGYPHHGLVQDLPAGLPVAGTMPASPRLALVVGASRGLGLGLAREYLDRGWQVIGTVRDTARHTGLHQLRDRHGAAVEIEALDINDPGQVAALRGRLAGRALDLLFVNAGIANGPGETVAQTTTEEFTRVLVTNALSPMRVVEALSPLVRPGGTIAAMSSGLGSVSNNDRGGWEVYRASKAALNTLMRSYAVRHAADRHTILLLAPGWVRTDMGGPNATLDIATSIRGLADVIATHETTPGVAYLDYQGSAVPW